MFTIKSTVFLDCIVGQMNHFITNIIKIEYFWGSSDVALAVPISPHDSVYPRDDHVMTYVKFSAFVE